MPRIFLRRSLVSAVVASCLLPVPSAFAMGLMQAYDAALQNDPVYRSAIFENEAGRENRALGRSGLLPNAQINYSTNKNKADYTQPSIIGPYTTHPEYTSSSGTLSVRQVLFSLDAYARYKQGIAQSDYSDAVFSGRKQDLISRLFGAYSDAKYAEDQLNLLVTQRDAFAEQKRVNARTFEKGEGTKTDMLETQAKLDLAEAQLIEQQDNLTNARNTLASIVGQDVQALDGLVENFRVLPLTPSSYEEWQSIALENNSEIAAGKFSVSAAEQEVKKNRAGHTPRLDLEAAYSKAKSDSLNNLNTDSTTKSIGLQLVIPLYSGGSVNAATSQAVANRERAKSDLDATTKKVLVELRKQYSQVLSSSTKINALLKSVASADELVKATKQSVKGGGAHQPGCAQRTAAIDVG